MPVEDCARTKIAAVERFATTVVCNRLKCGLGYP
jgi:hypothetical protein